MTTGADHAGRFQEDRYGPVLERQGESPTMARIWGEVYRDDWVPELELMSFVTLSDLRRIIALAGPGAGQTMVDLGCGRGGPGMWIARETGVSLRGIDIVPQAVREASRRAGEFGLTGRAEFTVGTFADTGLPSASADLVISIDSFWMVLDKAAAIAEVRRILADDGAWAMTTWVPGYLNYPEMLAKSGLEIVHAEEPQAWRERQVAVYREIERQQERLRGEMGREAAAVLVEEARSVPAFIDTYRRLLMVIKPKREESSCPSS